MTKKFLTLMLLWGSYLTHTLACTSLLAGKAATTDGSTMITYAADSYTLYGELYYTPAATHPKRSFVEINEWDTGKPLGRIPQVEQTYAVVGNMNEHQLAISESTWGGRAELQDTTGIIDYGSLIYITLQRAKTAREAITVMTNLVKKYGYYSSGESFSIADPNEAWIMEMVGKGVGNKGAVWVAIRIPDDCISAHANQSRIHQFPLNDKANCLYSPDVISFAREQKYFNGLNREFSFSKAYAPADFFALRSCEARVWSFFNRHTKGMEQYLPFIAGKSEQPMPLYIKPDAKLSLQDMKSAMRDHYEGTPFDMRHDLGAGAYKSPYRPRPLSYTVDSVSYANERPIATQQTGFTFVAQLRSSLPDAIGGVLWFGVDDANTTLYTPMYCSIKEIPTCYKVGTASLSRFSWESAFWVHNWVANMAYARYSHMIPDIRERQQTIEQKFEEMQPIVEQVALELYRTNPKKATAYLTDYSVTQAQNAIAQWRELGEYLMVRFVDGCIKRVEDGQFIENGHGCLVSPQSPGFSQEYYRAIVKESGDKFKVNE